MAWLVSRKPNSRVSQGSLRGSLFLIIDIRDLRSVSSNIGKFADDTKILAERLIRSSNNADVLQGDSNKLYEPAMKWQIQFDISKCCILMEEKRI